MSIKKRGSTYYTDFTCPQSKRIRISTGTSDKRQAQEFEDKLKNDLWRQAKLGEKPKYLLSDAIIRYFKVIVGQKSEKDVNNDRTKLAFWLKALGDIPLSDITHTRLSEIIDDLTYERNGVTYPAKSATKNRYISPLRRLLNLARTEWGWIDTYVKFPTKALPLGRDRWLTPEEVSRLIAAAPAHMKNMILFALVTGVRKSKIINLKWSQINTFNNTLALSQHGNKNKKPLAVPLNPQALMILRQEEGKHLVHVFTYEGNPMSDIEHRTWKKLLEKVGIEDFRWHDLRHTWASWHIQNSTPMDVLMRLGGWSSSQMVLRYAHHSAAQLAAASHNITIDLDTNLSHDFDTEEKGVA